MELPKKKNMTEEEYEKRVYRRIIYLALVAHTSYIILFALLSCPLPSVYNIASVLFYFVMLRVIRKGSYRLALTTIHFEVCLFVCVCILSVGWDMGIQFYLVALSSLVYFCPFRHKYIPYLFSGMEIAVFFVLKFITLWNTPFYPALPARVNLWLYLYNAAACFAVILYSAFLSNVSAAIGKRELQRQNKSLRILANHDQLTGLLSRRPFLRKLEERSREDVVIAMGDIDNFKVVNDTYGHACGDYVLHTAASIMAALCRNDAELCRWGGEEFIFLFCGKTLDEVREIVQRICNELNEYEFIYNHNSLHITMTFGIGKGRRGMEPAALIDAVDKRMYYGKLHGKNCVISDDAV